MRLAPLLAVLLAAPALHAQCTPDPTPPASYYPLGVGDEWVYHVRNDPSAPGGVFVQRRVVREEAVGGQTYAVDQTCRTPAAGGATTCEPERRVRFDGASSILMRLPDGSEQVVLTRLDAGLTRGPLFSWECMVDIGTGPVRIGGTDYSVAQVKSEYSIDFGPPALASGIGQTGYQGPPGGPFLFSSLEYARVGGRAYGVHPTEPGPDPLPAEAYAPLAVGTRREFRLHGQNGPTTGYRRETVVRDTLIAGVTWHVRRDQTFSATRERTSEVRRVLRFDAATANVAERTAAGTSLLYPCRLDLDRTGDSGVACAPGTTYTKQTRPVLPDAVATTVAFGYDFGTTRVAAGFGLTLRVSEGTYTELVAPVAGLPFVPDPTPAAEYYPLEVGNEWVYRYTENSANGTGDRYERRRVLREASADGQTYAVDQVCTYNRLAPSPAWICAPERLVRFDAVTTDVVERRADGGEAVVLCRLGSDFDAPLPDGCGARYASRYGLVFIGDGPGSARVYVPSAKQVETLANVPPAVLYAGIGPGSAPVGPFQTSRFEFARVRGVEYGVRPVAGEPSTTPAEVLALTTAPNPTSGALRLTVTLPEAQTVAVEAFDALGRRVWQLTAALGAGAQTLTVDASAWAPGVYVVRVVAGQATATARVVRR